MMELTLTKKDIKEVENIINNFVKNMKESTTSIAALGYCLNELMNSYDKLKEMLDND